MKKQYDLVVIGGGAAGLTGAGVAVSVGAKTMLVESHKLGGDCTWYGCIPSKILIKAAKVAHHSANGSQFGLNNIKPDFNWKSVREHIHNVRQEVYDDADRPEIFEELGIDVRHAKASFVDAHTINLHKEDGSEEQVTSRKFLIATGSSAMVPPIEGIEQVSYLTNENLFDLDDFPQKLAVVGAGPIGSEMAQSFRRLGAEVTVVDMLDRVLPRDNPEVTGILQQQMEHEGIRYIWNSKVNKVEEDGSSKKLHIENKQGETTTLEVDQILIAAGRRPNISGLGLDKAGLQYDPAKGIQVNDKCRTNKRHIFAAGDITGRYQFTHMSDHMAKVAVSNALLKFPMKIEKNFVPWVTFTDPEVGHAGMTEQELKGKNISYKVYRFPYTKMDRAITESETEGWIRVYGKPMSGKILGIDAVGTNAGEIVSQYAMAMRNGVTMKNIADTIFPYPTFLLGGRRVSDQWYVQNQSPFLVRVIKTLFGYRGPLPDVSNPDRIV